MNSWPRYRPGYLLAQSACFLCGGLLLAQLAGAAAATPYGEYFVRLDQARMDAGGITADPTPGPDADSAARDNAAFERQLSLLEAEGGPYADTLAEPLADLARLHRRRGDIAQAQQVFQRALHVVRINDGLYSERQVPILRELFETYRMSGDMATLDARYDYFFRLYGSGQAPFTPLRLGAAVEYLRWQREALRLELDQRDADRLLALYSLNERILQAVDMDPSVDYASYRALVLSQLRNLYLVLSRYEPEPEPGVRGSQYVMPTAWDEQDATRHRLDALQRSALAQGRGLLDKLIARTPPDETETLAGAWLELGDWNQWNDSRSEALAAYRQVEAVLRESGNLSLLQQWLGEPAELPANGAFWQPGSSVGQGQAIVVQARFDVSARGRVDNIETSASSEAGERKAGKLRRNLAQTRFRPRIVNGEPEPALHLQRDYEVLD
ncbi:MAG: tetratricopeptide repeat protein [Halieaceae bacterium]|jgi:hypothetical protein|nr:tetratricopeptide repeat protein [Halieaceae bacterium]